MSTSKKDSDKNNDWFYISSILVLIFTTVEIILYCINVTYLFSDPTADQAKSEDRNVNTEVAINNSIIQELPTESSIVIYQPESSYDNLNPINEPLDTQTTKPNSTDELPDTQTAGLILKKEQDGTHRKEILNYITITISICTKFFQVFMIFSLIRLINNENNDIDLLKKMRKNIAALLKLIPNHHIDKHEKIEKLELQKNLKSLENLVSNLDDVNKSINQLMLYKADIVENLLLLSLNLITNKAFIDSEPQLLSNLQILSQCYLGLLINPFLTKDKKTSEKTSDESEERKKYFDKRMDQLAKTGTNIEVANILRVFFANVKPSKDYTEDEYNELLKEFKDYFNTNLV